MPESLPQPEDSAGAHMPVSLSGDPVRFLERLRQAIDAHAIVAVTDARGVILFVNDRFTEISGYRRDELIGQTHRIINSGYHPEEYFREMWQTISSGRVWHGVFRNRAKNGRHYWVDSTIVPVPGAEGRPEYYVALRTDITRLKQIEEELGRLTQDLERRVQERTAQLARSENLYRLLLSSVTDYHYTVTVRDGQAVATTHTPACLAVTGYAEEEFAQMPDLWIRMVHPDDREAVGAHARAALEGRALPPLEHRIVRKDGAVRWIRDTIVIRRDERGRVAFYDGIITDVTAERTAREEVALLNQDLERRVQERTAQLKAANEQFQLLFDNAPVGISWVEFREGREIYHLNDRFCRLIGLGREEAEDFRNILAVTHPEDRARQLELMDGLRRGEFDSFSMEKRYVHRDGRTVWADLTVAVLRGEGGRITQQFAMLEDITERRRAEENLRRSEQRFRGYVENASEILYSLNARGIFQFVSPSWTAKLGHAPADVVGRSFTEFVHAEDIPRCHAYLRDVLAGTAPGQGIEYRVRHQDGSWRWHASTGTIGRDEQGSPTFFGVGRDITARKEAQEALRAALARREEMERIVNRSPSVVVLWRAEEGWPVEFVSESIRQFGYEPAELIGRQLSFLDITHPEDRARVAAETQAHADAGHRDYHQEYRILARDGTTHWVDDRTLVRTDEQGRVTHHEGLLTDITERKLAEEREREVRERDLRTAREVQHHLLPSVYPDISEAEIAALYVPSRLVGGDYYDFFPVDERRWGFAIADVSGKGAAAALMMASCRTALRVHAAGGGGPAAVLRAVNRTVQPDMPQAMFISLVYGLLDLDSNVFTFCRAGHEPPLVLRQRDGEVLTLCPAGMAIGLDPGPVFDDCLEEASVALDPHDLLVLYTDGITEAADAAGVEFGRHRLAEVLRSEPGRALAETRARLREALERFSPDVTGADDRTLVLVRPR